MILLLLRLGVYFGVGTILYLLTIALREGNIRRKLERHNDLGDHLGDHIDEGEWEHGE